MRGRPNHDVKRQGGRQHAGNGKPVINPDAASIRLKPLQANQRDHLWPRGVLPFALVLRGRARRTENDAGPRRLFGSASRFIVQSDGVTSLEAIAHPSANGPYARFCDGIRFAGRTCVSSAMKF